MPETLTIHRSDTLADELRRGLAAQPKRLPCRLFYDEEGSRLFEEICRRPEYYVPAAETEIIAARRSEIIERSSYPSTMVELGSGSATKTRLLIETALASGHGLRYVPIDVSASAVEESVRLLATDYPTLTVEALVGEYQAGLDLLASKDWPNKLVLWLGSNIGNLTREEAAVFLARVGDTLGADGRLLVGIDMRKDRDTLEAAYNDEAGLTARFNLNILARLNRDFGADFDLDAFSHRAVYREDEGRIEMHLVCDREQRINVAGLGAVIEMAAGDFIHTESSHKYSQAEIEELAGRARLRLEESWTDGAARFSSVLFARP